MASGCSETGERTASEAARTPSASGPQPGGTPATTRAGEPASDAAAASASRASPTARSPAAGSAPNREDSVARSAPAEQRSRPGRTFRIREAAAWSARSSSLAERMSDRPVAVSPAPSDPASWFCGSASTSTIRLPSPRLAKPAAKLEAVVVLPVPPLVSAIASVYTNSKYDQRYSPHQCDRSHEEHQSYRCDVAALPGDQPRQLSGRVVRIGPCAEQGGSGSYVVEVAVDAPSLRALRPLAAHMLVRYVRASPPRSPLRRGVRPSCPASSAPFDSCYVMTRTLLRERIALALANQALGQSLTDADRRLIASPLARPYETREAELAAASGCPLEQFERLSGHRLS